jgi:hypothetical protein
MATSDSSAPANPSTREDRALELYRTRRNDIERIAPDIYLEPSCSGEGAYRVRYGTRESCECPDFAFGHGRACKHLLVIGIMHAARRGGVREIRKISVASGDPFRAAGSRRLGALEERYHHDLLDEEERLELRDQVLRLRQRLGR